MITAVTILLCLLHILASVNGNCDTNPFTRSPCDRIKPVPDRLTCVLKNCCYDDRPGIGLNARCYKKGFGLGSVRFLPSAAPELQNVPTQLTVGGGDGYPGSILRRSCSKFAPLCKTFASYNSKAACARMSCCFINGQCYKAIFNVIGLRDRCEPGRGGPPRCKEYKLVAVQTQLKWPEAQTYCQVNYNGHLIQFDPRLSTVDGRRQIFNSLGLASQWYAFFVGIKRDPNDNSVWRRASDQQVFPIASGDWDAGFPKSWIARNTIALIFNPNNLARHGMFKNKNGYEYPGKFICEYL